VTAPNTLRLVIEREVRESLRRRAVWIVMALLILGSTALVVLPEIIGGGSGDATVALVGNEEQRDRIGDAMAEVADTVDVELEIVVAPDRVAATRLVDDDDVDAAVLLTESPPVVVTDDADAIVVSVARQAVATTALIEALEQSGKTETEAGEALAGGQAVVDEREPDAGGRRAAAVVLSIVLYVLRGAPSRRASSRANVVLPAPELTPAQRSPRMPSRWALARRNPPCSPVTIRDEELWKDSAPLTAR
jgi:hypothetical protein